MLGEEVREKLSGFTGTATAQCEHITGCVEVLVVANKLGADGKPVEAWFDESRLTITRFEKKTSAKKKGKRIGGPRDSKPPARNRPNMETSYKTYDGPRQST